MSGIKTEFTRSELEEFLDKKPDTKLKGELMEFISPTQSETEKLHAYVQHVYDVIVREFGCKGPVNVGGPRERYSGPVLKIGRCELAFNVLIDYQSQQKIHITPQGSRFYTKVEIAVSPESLEADARLAKTIVDQLNGDE